MSEFFFVVKTVLFSFLVLLGFQMKVGRATVEQHSERFIYESRVGNELQAVAQGAVRAGHNGWSWIQENVGGIKISTGSSSSSSEEKRERPSRKHSPVHDLD